MGKISCWSHKDIIIIIIDKIFYYYYFDEDIIIIIIIILSFLTFYNYIYNNPMLPTCGYPCVSCKLAVCFSHGKTGRSGRVKWVGGSKQVIFKQVGLGRVYPYFSKKFFSFQLQKQINDNLFRENE